MLRQKLAPLFKAIHTNQTQLKGINESLMVKLAQKSNVAAQAKRNAVTDHEVKFAELSEEHGFQYLASMKKDLPEEGFYYVFEPNGSQQSPDFKFVSVKENKVQEEQSVDLKHSLGKTIVLNDGWFEEGIIYVITYTKNKTTNTFLGLGERIPTQEEKTKMEQIKRIKKELNMVADKNVGNLHTYIRFANRYECERFTEEFLEAEYTYLIDWLESKQQEQSKESKKLRKVIRREGIVVDTPVNEDEEFNTLIQQITHLMV